MSNVPDRDSPGPIVPRLAPAASIELRKLRWYPPVPEICQRDWSSNFVFTTLLRVCYQFDCHAVRFGTAPWYFEQPRPGGRPTGNERNASLTSLFASDSARSS